MYTKTNRKLIIMILILSTKLFAGTSSDVSNSKSVDNMEYIKAQNESSVDMLIKASEKYKTGSISKDKYVEISLQVAQMADYYNKTKLPTGATITQATPVTSATSKTPNSPTIIYASDVAQTTPEASAGDVKKGQSKIVLDSGGDSTPNLTRAEALTKCQKIYELQKPTYILCKWDGEVINSIGNVPDFLKNAPSATSPTTETVPTTAKSSRLKLAMDKAIDDRFNSQLRELDVRNRAVVAARLKAAMTTKESWTSPELISALKQMLAKYNPDGTIVFQALDEQRAYYAVILKYPIPADVENLIQIQAKDDPALVEFKKNYEKTYDDAHAKAYADANN